MSILKQYQEMSGGFWGFISDSGEIGEIFKEHYNKTYETGAIDTKTKRMMAMVGAMAHGCEGCIIGQGKRAIENGATRQEILEACSVALSLGGTMAGIKTSLIVKLLDEMGIK